MVELKTSPLPRRGRGVGGEGRVSPRSPHFETRETLAPHPLAPSPRSGARGKYVTTKIQNPKSQIPSLPRFEFRGQQAQALVEQLAVVFAERG